MSELVLTEDGFGRYFDGVLDTLDIQNRELAQAANIHESEISRIRNGRKQADFKQKLQLGRGLGRIEMQRAKK